MPDINLAPYDVQAQQLARKRQLAQALQQQSMEPLQDPGYAGAKISPVQGFAKLAQALIAAYQNKKIDQQQTALSKEAQGSKENMLSNMAKALMPVSAQPQGQISMGQPSPLIDQLPPDAQGGMDAQGMAPVPQQLPQDMPQSPPQNNMPAVGANAQDVLSQVQGQQQKQKALASALSSNTPEGQMMGQQMIGQYNKQQDIALADKDKREQMRMAEAAAQQQLRLKQMEGIIIPKDAVLHRDGMPDVSNNAPSRPSLGEANLSDFTPASLQAYQQTGNPSVLVPAAHPQNPPQSTPPMSPAALAQQEQLIRDRERAVANNKAPAEMAPELLSALTEAAKTNPDSLKKLSPKDYAQVLARLQQTGGVQPDKVQGIKESMRDQALDSAKWLRDNFAPGAVGAKGPASLGGILSEPLPGTSARDFTDKFNTFKNQIVLPNLDMLKGLGRVTDREFQALQQSMSSISRSNSEAQFKTELNKIITTLENMKTPTTGIPANPGMIGPAMQQLINAQKK